MTYKKLKELLFCIKIFSSYLMAAEAFHFCKPACKTIGLHLNMSCWELGSWSAYICRSHTVSFPNFSIQAHSKWRMLNFLSNSSFSQLYFHLLVKREFFFFQSSTLMWIFWSEHLNVAKSNKSWSNKREIGARIALC